MPRRYRGLFSLIEEVDANFVQDRFGSKTGALLKPVPVSLFTYLSDNWANYSQTYDSEDGPHCGAEGANHRVLQKLLQKAQTRSSPRTAEYSIWKTRAFSLQWMSG